MSRITITPDPFTLVPYDVAEITALVEDAAARALMPEIMRLMASDDAREGLMSFLERRNAKFTGT